MQRFLKADSLSHEFPSLRRGMGVWTNCWQASLICLLLPANKKSLMPRGLLLLLVAWLTLGSARAIDLRAVESFHTPGGADCVAATPIHPNGKLLLIAHGFIPAARPLNASLRLDDPVYRRRLIDAGWTVAATSYRRNGMILADGAADVEALRQEIARRHGPFSTVLIEGTSMGGYIAASLAENPPDPSYRGALALGAALKIEAPEDAARPLTGKPKFPLLFLSTQDEIAGPADYARRAGDKAAAWKVTRDGHVNLNRAETGAAYDALLAWIEGAAIEPSRDATLPPPARPLTAAFSADGHTVTAQVIDVDPVYGNLTIDLRPEDTGKLGWRKGDWASLRIGDHGGVFPILHGSSFGDVKEGAWVSFPTAEGQMLICRNFADAAATSGAKIGTPVEFTRPPTD